MNNNAIRSRSVCFTSFKCEEFLRTDWNSFIPDDIAYIVYGEEICPRTGKQHIQGYVEFNRVMSLTAIKRILGDNQVHVEPRRGSQKAAIDYCKKDGKYHEYGEPKTQGKRSDLEDCKRLLDEGASQLDIAEAHFGDFVRYNRGLALYADLQARKRQKQREPMPPEVIVYVGDSGTGKSHRCWHDEDYQTDGYKYLCQAKDKVFFDGYEGESVLWFDEFGGSVLPFGIFLQLTDKWGCRVEIKGGSVEVFAKKILISTTEWPANWWNCPKFNRDPYQLYRRITKLYFIAEPRGEPELLTDITKPNHGNDRRQ